METLEKKVDGAVHVSLKDIRVTPIKTIVYNKREESRLDIHDTVGYSRADTGGDCECHCATY